MSNIYVQEPPTEGKVCLETSVGEIDIELWSKECPKACRNFVQLCMEGYYDKTKFFRVVPDFIVQGGDPTNSGSGGESIWGKPFRDEFHSRLRFVRRGLVAMANAGKDDNGSQFFFTLGATKELQNKHTIFGKVGGNTIYNMIRLGQGVIEDGERPKYPHKILKTNVLINPFPDIEPRMKIEMERTGEESEKKKSKMKATKNFSLLSFGEEAEEDEMDTEKVTKENRGKGKSAHDLASDPKLLSQADKSQLISKQEKTSDGEGSDNDEKLEQEINSIRSKLKRSKESSKKAKEEASLRLSDDDELDFGEDENPFEAERRRRKEQLQAEAKALSKELKNKDKKKDKESRRSDEPEEEKLTEEETKNDMLRDYHKKQKEFKSVAKVPKSKSDREAQTLAMLAKFKNKLSGMMYDSEDDEPEEKSKKETSKPVEEPKKKEEGEENDEDIEGDDWMKAPLVFDTDGPILAKDANTKDDDWFDIYDPRNKLNKRRRERDAKGERDRNRKEKMMKL
eukprot:TRINITY_DN3513_c0_g1_i19.p1 TRINITY_DN3513_c0_g1~~TRINITY_DN3513_c0_g1_i19.p1  ORF type:complete len:510 (-),score=164.08 TRINITY_DN3513_c0_g1_i19:486-2015(-)